MDKREEMVSRLSRWQYAIGYAEGVLAGVDSHAARSASDILDGMSEELDTFIIEGLPEAEQRKAEVTEE